VPVTSEFQNGIFVVTVVGDFGPGELTGAIVAGYSDPYFAADTPVLVDTRRSVAVPSGADVHQSSRSILGRRPAGHTGRFAIVTRSEPLRFGLARMAALTMESLGATMAVFHEPDAALKFLGSSGS
jgi:hypothetical protein